MLVVSSTLSPSQIFISFFDRWHCRRWQDQRLVRSQYLLLVLVVRSLLSYVLLFSTGVSTRDAPRFLSGLGPFENYCFTQLFSFRSGCLTSTSDLCSFA